MSAPTESCLPSTKAKEAVKYVIGMVLDFNPVDDCPLWLALIHDVMDESRVNLYNQWLWLTLDDILTLEYCPDPSKQKIVPLSRGYHTQGSRQCILNFNIPLAGQTLTFSRLLMTSTWHSPGDTWLARLLRTRCHWHLMHTLHPLIRLLCSRSPSSENTRTFLLSNHLTSGIASNVR
jgi:hypothetical protein